MQSGPSIELVSMRRCASGPGLSGYEQDSVAGVMAAAVDSLRETGFAARRCTSRLHEMSSTAYRQGHARRWQVSPKAASVSSINPECTDENARQNDIYRYDVRHKTWACIDPVTGSPPSARSGSKAVVCRDSIFFFGGYTKKDGDYFNDLFEFNIPKAHWTRLDAAQIPSVRTDHSCVVFEASLYIFGGFDGRTRFQDLHLFNTEEREWMQDQGLPKATIGAGIEFACGAIATFDGEREGQRFENTGQNIQAKFIKKFSKRSRSSTKVREKSQSVTGRRILSAETESQPTLQALTQPEEVTMETIPAIEDTSPIGFPSPADERGGHARSSIRDQLEVAHFAQQMHHQSEIQKFEGVIQTLVAEMREMKQEDDGSEIRTQEL
eukprot:s4236_g5.t1